VPVEELRDLARVYAGVLDDFLPRRAA
jgi:hypothetical protein